MTGTAWGEWGVEELTKLGLKSVPAGLERISTLWGARFADYEVPILGNMTLGYIFSAVFDQLLVGTLAWLLTLLVTGSPGKRERSV